MNTRSSGAGRAWCAVALMAAASRCALGADAEPPAVARLLPDRTLALVVIEDVSRTLDGLRETSPGRLWADPEFQAFAAPVREHLAEFFEKAAADLRVALADVLPLLEGQMALAILKPPRVGGMPDILPELAAVVDVSDTAAVGRTLDRIAAGFTARGTECRAWEEDGVRFLAAPLGDAPFDAHVALAGGRLLVTISPDAKLVRGMLAAARGDGEGRTLARDADFMKAVERAGRRREVFAYLSVARTSKAIFELARVNAPPREFMKARLIYEALGLDGVRSVSLSASIDPPGFRTGLFIHAPAPRKGVLTLLSEEPMRASVLGATPRKARGLLAWSVKPDRVPGLAREVATAAGPDEAAGAEGPLTALETQLAKLGDFGSEGVLFAERAGVEPLVELSSVVLALRTGRREALEPLYRMVAGIASAAAAEHGLAIRDETLPGGELLRALQLPLGFSPTVALSDDYIVAAPTRGAVLRALARLSTAGGAEGEDAGRLVETPECREAMARVGEPTFLFAYRRAWRAEDYAPMMAVMPALAGFLYGVAAWRDAPPEVVEFLGKINIPAMPSPELLARHSIPSVVVGRADADGVSVFGWGPGLYPGGLSASGTGALLAVAPLAAVAVPNLVEGPIDRMVPGRPEEPQPDQPVPFDEAEW